MVESFNYGDCILKISFVDFMVLFFGWYDEDGMFGLEYIIIRGNNVYVYYDIFDLNVFVGDELDGGDFFNFDFLFDLFINWLFIQIDLLVINLFYWNNIMYDVWYYYGFDEVVGNF